MAVHRTYNINANFDVIEISGEYDRAVRAALNQAIQALVDSHTIDQDALEFDEDVLRVRDPTDSLVLRVPRPSEVSWIDVGLSDDEFARFADIGRLKTSYSQRDDEWVTLFEYTEQRIGERFGSSDPQRATRIEVTLFGVEQGSQLSETIKHRVQRGALPRLRNCYRFELARSYVSSTFLGIVPLVAVSRRAFRGRWTPDLAAFVPNIARDLRLTPDSSDMLGYCRGGSTVVRSIEWQEAFDQGRRRHEPRSVGFLLKVRREILEELAQIRGLELCAHISARRSTDRYKPEAEMNWHEHLDVFSVKLSRSEGTE